MTRKSSTETLIAAMRILARDIQSGDGVANAAIAEAADRLEEQEDLISDVRAIADKALTERNQFGLDVQNAALTGQAPPQHPLGNRLELVAALKRNHDAMVIRLADLERQAAHDVTLTNEGNITDRQLADAVNELRAITAAADAVIERWHTPLSKDAKPTAEYIAALRLAAESARKLLAWGE